MTTLFLKYKTESGEVRRSKIDGETFIVGRHSEADLSIADGRLSRRHLMVERFEDVYVVSDAGSSNGSMLNGRPLLSPTAIKHGDIIDLGGFEIAVFAEVAAPAPSPKPVSGDAAEPIVEMAPVEAIIPAADSIGGAPSGVVAQSVPEPAGSSSSTMLLLLIPVFGLILLVFGGAVIYLIVSQPKTTVVAKQDDDLYGDYKEKETKNSSTKSDDKTENKSETTTNLNSGNSSGTTTSANSANTAKLSETAKIEQNGGAFLRQIAQNNPRAFLTGEQAQQLSGKIKQLSGSSALADNLKNAQKNSAAIRSLASSKNLKPQLLAVAAIAKLGNSRGDVVQTAQGMSEVLDKLSTQLGNELADDSLLVIAAYGQGAAGEFMKMRNMLQDLANKSPQSSREIRSIWFLHKIGKITQSEFDNALSFLAIGTIAQNPKDFGVSAEALSF